MTLNPVDYVLVVVHNIFEALADNTYLVQLIQLSYFKAGKEAARAILAVARCTT